MSRTTDYVIELMNLESDWLGFLSALLERLGYDVAAVEPGPRAGPDLTAELNGNKIVFEFKLYRNERTSRTLIRNALSSLDRMVAQEKASYGILVIPQPLYEAYYADVEAHGHKVWGLDQLIAQARPFPDLSPILADLLRALRVGAERQPDGPRQIAELSEASSGLPPIGAGAALAARLRALPTGRANGAAQDWERLCEEALKLLFPRDLFGWKSQSSIEHGFHRIDLIARLQPVESAFWATLASDFRTRYVVFEFKNYTDPINQDQIYSTEKYLYSAALRSVAIVIARSGLSESAMRAAHGALREQGKLILCLDMEEFCSMLFGFDRGDSPEELLVQKRDDILMSIGR